MLRRGVRICSNEMRTKLADIKIQIMIVVDLGSPEIYLLETFTVLEPIQ